jgi:hypothetical protein
VLVAAALLFIGLLPTSAFAQSSEKLTKYLPSASQMVVGMNVSKLSKSKYYKEALAWVNANASDEKAKQVLDDAQLDLSKDIDSIAIGIPNTQVDGSNPQRTFTMALSGSFDNKKLIEALKKGSKLKEVKKGKTVVYAVGDFELGFPKEGVVWLTGGTDKYRAESLEAMLSEKKSVRTNKLRKGMMSDVDTTQGFWLIGDTSKIKTKQAKNSPQPQSIGLSLDFAKGLDLNIFAELPSKEDAKLAVEQVETFKNEGSQKAMLSIFGAGPLLSNLVAKQDGAKLRASTSMTTGEFDILIRQVKQLAQTQMQGGGFQPSSPVPSKDKNGGDSSGGADADFN